MAVSCRTIRHCFQSRSIAATKNPIGKLSRDLLEKPELRQAPEITGFKVMAVKRWSG